VDILSWNEKWHVFEELYKLTFSGAAPLLSCLFDKMDTDRDAEIAWEMSSDI